MCIYTEKVSMLDYYSYRLMFRKGCFNMLHKARRLFQVYTTDMYAKANQWRINHARTHQAELRADLYKGLEDQLSAEDAKARNIRFTGKKFILPATYSYTPRWYDKKYRDAMAIVSKYRKPDLFITFTCNSKWKEITDELEPGQSAFDRPDLTARVFYMKFQELMKDLTKKHVLGHVVAWMHTIEFQKRGLPHAHILLIFSNDSKLERPEQFDQVVSAELPDRETNKHLYDLVVQYMIHEPCDNNWKTKCKKNGHSCGAYFPKEFTNHTEDSGDGYPKYRRRSPQYGGNTGLLMVWVNDKKKWVPIDNRWVVPYNPDLLQKYEAHINVEVCCSIKAIKYLYKYIYKGPDKASFAFKVRNNGQTEECNRDEIKRYYDAFYLSGAEACWKIFQFKMHSRCPNVEVCKFHLPGEQIICYRPDADLHTLMRKEDLEKTMLTEWFETNKREKDHPLPERALLKDLAGNYFRRGPELLFHEFPEHYKWESGKKFWKRRTQRDKVIGRMHRLSPKCGEQYYLRLILLHARGATSWDDLLTVNGVKYDRFRDVAVAMNLLQNDKEWHRCMKDAAEWKTGDALLQLFVTILLNCDVANPLQLWNEQKENMSYDVKHSMLKGLSAEHKKKITPERVEKVTLLKIQKLLNAHKKKLDDYSLPPLKKEDQEINAELLMELDYDEVECAQDVTKNVKSMNDEQKAFYKAVIDSIYGNSTDKLFFVDALGGTGKTFVAETILAHVRSKKHIAIAVAFSGIAALLLPGGRTLHSRFNLPCDFDQFTLGNINRRSHVAELLRQAKVIIWDEAPMAHRDVFECIDRTLRDITDNEHEPFGGKILVLSGDFRQVLPIVPKAARAQIVAACLNRSYLWQFVKIFRLTINERVKRKSNSDANQEELKEFADVLEQIGDGNYPIEKELGPDMIRIPNSWLSKAKNIDEFINEAFPNFTMNCENDDFLKGRAILTPKNVDVLQINNQILKKLPTEENPPIISIDQNVPDAKYKHGEEHFNKLDPSSLPPHKLYLKTNAVIMILRNLNPAQGACNGTRLKVIDFTNSVIHAKLLTGPNEGKEMFIPKISLYADKTSPIPYIRYQFPVKLAFAMTINKAQGQTLDHMSLYLPEPVFGHGQLYVACGRVGSKDKLSIYVIDGKTQGVFDGYDGIYTRNVVYKEVFDDKYGCEFSVNDSMSQDSQQCRENLDDQEYNECSHSSDEDIDLVNQQYNEYSQSSDEDIDMDNHQYNEYLQFSHKNDVNMSETSSDVPMANHPMNQHRDVRTWAQRQQSIRDKREMDEDSESE